MQKIYSDPFGRTYKTETFDWDDTDAYSTTKTTFDVLDRATLIRQFSGNEFSTTFQDTTFEFDGHGGLKKQHRPEQFIVDGNNTILTYTTYDYRADDRVQWVKDGRGAKTNFSYNNRGMVTSINYEVPNPNPTTIPATLPVSFTYDAVGNRLEMYDGTGNTIYSYDQLSRLTSETKTFTEIWQRTFTIGYGYNLTGQLTSITDPYNSQTSYGYNKIGKLQSVTGSGPNTMSTYISSINYRAFGKMKSVS
jgi:YD repeat-containing protein